MHRGVLAALSHQRSAARSTRLYQFYSSSGTSVAERLSATAMSALVFTAGAARPAAAARPQARQSLGSAFLAGGRGAFSGRVAHLEGASGARLGAPGTRVVTTAAAKSEPWGDGSARDPPGAACCALHMPLGAPKPARAIPHPGGGSAPRLPESRARQCALRALGAVTRGCGPSARRARHATARRPPPTSPTPAAPPLLLSAVTGYIKLALPAGKANPAPPVGPALGAKGVNIMDFCKQYNAATQVGVRALGGVSMVFVRLFDPNAF